MIAEQDIIGTYDNGTSYVLVPAGQEIPDGIELPEVEVVEQESEQSDETKTEQESEDAESEDAETKES